MNKADLIKEIKEITEVIKSCPQNLQEKCFEILLNNILLNQVKKDSPIVGINTSQKPQVNMTEIFPSDINRRIKTFAGQFSLNEASISKIFVIDESGNISIEVTDLKAKKTSQQQRRLALLIGTRHQFMEGAFDVPNDELREMSVTYGIYDAANFAANIKNFKEIFAGFKSGAKNKLSPIGKKEAADLIKELSL
ncbi:MAG: hypothetical protein WAV11_03765 [Minisyncoccia bacterium]